MEALILDVVVVGGMILDVGGMILTVLRVILVVGVTIPAVGVGRIIAVGVAERWFEADILECVKAELQVGEHRLGWRV